ncbi:MAG: hypothetical protein AB8F34_11780 [Akkermansiaceae bacterium]
MKRCFWVLWMIFILGHVVLPLSAENDEDLYELASDAADEQVGGADELLAEEERLHGKQWLTRGKLLGILAAWGALQIGLLVMVIRDLRRRGSGVRSMLGWIFAILVAGILAGLAYWLWRKRVINKVNK